MDWPMRRVCCKITFLIFLVAPQSRSMLSAGQAGFVSDTRFCDRFPGSNAQVKIAACIAAIPEHGGIADATRLEGTQHIDAQLDVGSATKPIVLLLGPATYILNSASVNLFTGSYVVGYGAGRDSDKSTTIRRGSGRSPMILAAGEAGNHTRGFGLRHLVLDGGNTVGDAILIRYADTFYVEDVHVSNGVGSSAMRLLDEAWDFWITNSSFTVWGDKANAMIELAGRNGEAVVTDGHWQANQFGELGKS